MATELAPEDQELLDLIVKRVRHFEDTLGCHYRDGLWAELYRLYHGWTRLRNALANTKGRNRDEVYNDARKEFGADLFIPHAYAIVETVLPALLSNRPRPLILPRGQASDRNVEHMRAMIDAQGGRADLELKLQDVVKSALMLGLGVGMSYWLRIEQPKTRLVPASRHLRIRGIKWAEETVFEPDYDDPTFEFIRAEDFGWDPFAADMTTARYAYRRTWRDPDYVNQKMAMEGGWDRIALKPEDLDDGNGSAERYRQSFKGSFEAQSIPIPNPQSARDSDIHEVIEYHDRGQIVTVLDRKWIVSVIPNTVWRGRLPFHIYRPTKVPGQVVGKGEIEPNRDLQHEMNDIRTGRRWHDHMSQGPVLFGQEGIVDPEKIHVGPGEVNLVNGDPKDLIWQMDIRGPGSSSYRETAEIAQDIVRTSGVSDTFAGGEAGSEATATGVQLELARASARIQLKTRRAELELMKPLASHWGALNQRHILEQREVRVPAPPEPGQPERRWAWFKLGPNELMGEFDYEVEGGSTAPENVPQMRQDAQIKTALMSGPLGALFDPRQMAISILTDMGLKNPESLLNQGALVPSPVLDVIVQHLVELGVPPELAQQIVKGSLEEVLAAQDQAAMGTDHGATGAQNAPPGPEDQGGEQAPQGEEQQAA